MRKADNLPPSCAAVMKSGSLNFLEPSGPLQACNGDCFYLLVGIPSSLFPSSFPKKKFVYIFYITHEFYMAQPYHLLHFITMLGAAWTVQIVLSSFKMFRNQFISEKNKTINNLTYISFKILPLCNYAFLLATVNMLETFREAILWKPFKLFRRIHKDVSSITKAPSLQCCF